MLTPLIAPVSVGNITVPPSEYNVIFAVIDDVGREQIAVYENEAIAAPWRNEWDGNYSYAPTPIIDALAKNGLLFPRMHTAAQCSPTRAQTITGRRSDNHLLGNAIFGDQDFEYAGDSLFKLMEEQGNAFQRLHVGKYHIGTGIRVDLQRSCRHPVDFMRADKYRGGPSNHRANTEIVVDPNYVNHTLCEMDLGGEPTIRTSLNPSENSIIYEEAKAIELIAAADTDDAPFFLNLWFHMGHTPTERDQWDADNLEAQGYNSYQDSPANRDEPALRVQAMTETVDTVLGNVIASMTAEQAARTMIVFLTDNGTDANVIDPSQNPTSVPTRVGPPTFYYNFQHTKRSPFELGIGAGLIINGPGVTNPGNGTTPRIWDGLTDCTDLFSLFSRWTGLRWRQGDNDAVTLTAAVDDENVEVRKYSVQTRFENQTPPPAAGGDWWWITAQNEAGWKLLFSSRVLPGLTGDWQLYDLNTDHQEENDLYLPPLSGDELTNFNDLQGELDRLGLAP